MMILELTIDPAQDQVDTMDVNRLHAGSFQSCSVINIYIYGSARSTLRIRRFAGNSEDLVSQCHGVPWRAMDRGRSSEDVPKQGEAATAAPVDSSDLAASQCWKRSQRRYLFVKLW